MLAREQYPAHEILANGGALLRSVGAIAIGNESTLNLIAEDQGSQEAFATFIDPEIPIDVETQLSFMHDFWSILGHEPQDLSGEQRDKAEAANAANAQFRILPTPLLEFRDRQWLAQHGRLLPGQQFDPIESAMRLPDEGTIYSELAHDLSAPVKVEGIDYAVRYKSPNGGVVDRAAYIANLLESQQALTEKGKEVWTFPSMDVQVNAPRVAEEAGQLYSRIDPIASPESLIVMQLLHQGAGSPNQTGAIDFANEAVYVQEEGSDAQEPSYIATVRWRTDWRRIGTYARKYASVRNYMGVREASSAI
jgi:hypothetical protein